MKKIKTPTVIIWGKQDKITPLSDALVMKNLIKNSKIFVIDKAKHSPFYEQPVEVAEIIQKNV